MPLFCLNMPLLLSCSVFRHVFVSMSLVGHVFVAAMFLCVFFRVCVWPMSSFWLGCVFGHALLCLARLSWPCVFIDLALCLAYGFKENALGSVRL